MAFSNASQTKTITVSHVNYGAYSDVFEFVVNLNQAPEKTVLSAPLNDAILVTDTQPIFTWNVPADPESHELHFQIEIDTSVNFDSQIGGLPLISADSYVNTDGFNITAAVPSGTGQVSYQPLVHLNLRNVYYWRARAFDGSRYGEWSEAWKLTVGILATEIRLEADRLYMPVADTEVAITASFVDRLGNVDVAINEVLIFVQSQSVMGVFTDASVEAENGIATTTYISSGVLGATHVRVVSALPHNVLILRSMVMGEVPILLAPANGSRLPSAIRPRLVWLVPDDPQGDLLHFKVEIFSSPLMNMSSLVYSADSSIDTTGFMPAMPIQPLAPQASHDVQIDLPDAKYWWRVTPFDTVYKVASEPFVFSMPNVLTVVSKPLLSTSPITQAVVMANVTIETGTELVPAVARHYVTNMALEPDEDIIWEEVTEKARNRSRHVFAQKAVPAHGWAVAIKTVIEANDATGRISLNGHGVVFDGEYVGTADEDYIGVLSSVTPIGFTALPVEGGDSIALTWSYVDLNTDNRRVIDKFIIEVYNPDTGEYEPYDGGTGEVPA
jgi:hypothetical protein